MFYNKKKNLEKKIDIIIELIKKSNLNELIYIMENKKEIITRNLLAGISRGVGIGIGITLITAFLLYLLRKIVALNIPIIGEYIADIIEIVEKSR